MGAKELRSQKPGLLTCLFPSSWLLSAQSQAPWRLWAVRPRLQPLSCTPCWTWRNLYRLYPHLPTIPQSTPAAQKQMHRGEACWTLLRELRQGEGAGLQPGLVGGSLWSRSSPGFDPLPPPASITYNGSMDSPVPSYPTDCPPSYEAVMGLRGDSQVRAGLGVGEGAGAKARKAE